MLTTVFRRTFFACTIALLLIPQFVLAANHLPDGIFVCTQTLATDFNTKEQSGTPMDVSTYSDLYRQCFVKNGGEAFLPVDTGVGYKDFSGAACLVAAENNYRVDPTVPGAEKDFQASMAACYAENKPPTETADTSSPQLNFVDSGDVNPASTEQQLALAACLRQHILSLTTTPTAEQDRQIAQCFTQAGMKNTALGYTNVAHLLDCAHEASGVTSFSQFSSLTPQQYEYYRQCVIARVVVPGSVVAAVAAVPLASGFGNIFLYFQFLFTQPALLFFRRKGNRGKVVDSLTALPLDLSTVRLLRLPERAVVKTIVTGANGDYIFIPPPGDYALEALRRDYVFPSQYHEGYRGEPLAIATADQVVDKTVPLDHKEIMISVPRFIFTKWRRKFARVLAFAAPVVSLVSCVITPQWWTIGLFVLQLVLLALFYRLGQGSRSRVFGVVKDEQGTTLTGAVVSLFDKKFNKLVYYSVTDIFGRYTLPEASGVFAVSFAKPGYTPFRRDFTLNDTLTSADVQLTKIVATTV